MGIERLDSRVRGHAALTGRHGDAFRFPQALIVAIRSIRAATVPVLHRIRGQPVRAFGVSEYGSGGPRRKGFQGFAASLTAMSESGELKRPRAQSFVVGTGDQFGRS